MQCSAAPMIAAAIAKVDLRRRRTASRCGGESEPRSVFEGVLRGASLGAAEVMAVMAACSATVSLTGVVEGEGEGEHWVVGVGAEEEGIAGGLASATTGVRRLGGREASSTGSNRKSRPGSVATGCVVKSRSMSKPSITVVGETCAAHLDAGDGSSGIE